MKATTECTLRELLDALNDITENDHEVAATVAGLVNSGQVRLTGNFAGAQIGVPQSFAVFPHSVWPSLLALPNASDRLQHDTAPEQLAA